MILTGIVGKCINLMLDDVMRINTLDYDKIASKLLYVNEFVQNHELMRSSANSSTNIDELQLQYVKLL